MRFEVLTLFPEILEGFQKSSLIGKAINRGLISIHVHDLRPFGQGRHRQVDDRPYGGGPGMVLKAEPIYQAMRSINRKCGGLGAGSKKYRSRAFALSPRGVAFAQITARELSQLDRLILLAGHYEGIDERVISRCFDGEISVGPYVTMGGETPAMVVIEATSRLIPGVVKEPQSVIEDSFSIQDNAKTLLEWPHYTRPQVWRGKTIPKVLRGGNHAKIKEWRMRKTRRAD